MMMRVMVQNFDSVKMVDNSGAAKCCRHCGSDLNAAAAIIAGAVQQTTIDDGFCCAGCATAFHLIRDLGLGTYYALPDRISQAATKAALDIDYAALDTEAFAQQHLRRFTTQGGACYEARLQIDGLTCYSCVWLCEQALRRLNADANISLSLSTGILHLSYRIGSLKLSEVARTLHRLGHRPTPLKPGEAPSQRPELIRIGVAAFAALNTMSFALAEYFAAPDEIPAAIGTMMRWMSLLLATGSLFYAGAPLWRSALGGVRHRRPTVDLGVVVGLAAAWGLSAVNTLNGHGLVYFDSVTAVVALLLSGRFVQNRFLAKVAANQRGGMDLQSEFVRRVGPEGTAMVPLTAVRRGETFKVLPGEVIPLAGTIVTGQGEINMEPLTGEATPVGVGPGTHAQAATINQGQPLTIVADEDGYNCYLGQACGRWSEFMREKSHYAALADRLAGRFFAVTMVLAAATLLWLWPSAPVAATERTVALLLVACPCVFGFATPLVMASCGARALRAGAAFRSPRAIEHLAGASVFCFDKTGTLTTGSPSVQRAEIDDRELAKIGLDSSYLRSVLLAMADGSTHHVPRSIAAWAAAHLPPAATGAAPVIADVTETAGAGLQARCGAREFRLGQPSYCHTPAFPDWATAVLAVDGRVLAGFALSDQPRADAAATVSALRDRGLKVVVLSGDQPDRTALLAKNVGIDAATGALTPADKVRGIHDLHAAHGAIVMVGNAFNDSLAMASAQVAVAVAEAGTAARQSADVLLTKSGLSPILVAVAYSRAAVGAIRRCFAFAATYNLVAMGLAMAGLVSPVVAALLMPANSCVITVLATKWRPERGLPT